MRGKDVHRESCLRIIVSLRSAAGQDFWAEGRGVFEKYAEIASLRGWGVVGG